MEERKKILIFGYGWAAILSLFAGRIYWKDSHNSLWLVLAAIALCLLLLTVFNIRLLQRIYGRWMKVGERVGHLLSSLVLIVFFYSMFMPAGLILRLLKKDLLDQAIDRRKQSYWVKRSHRPFVPEEYKRQF